MLVKYKKQANVAAAVWLVTLIALLAVISSTEGNIWESGDVLGMALMFTSGGAFWFSFWAYAKAKGYSSFLGLVLPWLSVVGLIILAALPDKHPELASDIGSTNLTGNAPTIEEKLTELKRLNDLGLISQEVYLERQRMLLEGNQ